MAKGPSFSYRYVFVKLASKNGNRQIGRDDDWYFHKYAADTSRKLIPAIFQVLIVVSTRKVMDMINYLHSYSSTLTDLTYECLEDDGDE